MKHEAVLKGYYAEAAAWDADRVAQGRRTVRLALGVAGAGWVAVLLLGAALMLLMLLKRVEPFVVRVDNATGVVDVVPVYAGHTGMQAANIGFKPHLIRVERQAGHGEGKPTAKVIEEFVDLWALAARETGMRIDLRR